MWAKSQFINPNDLAVLQNQVIVESAIHQLLSPLNSCSYLGNNFTRSTENKGIWSPLHCLIASACLSLAQQRWNSLRHPIWFSSALFNSLDRAHLCCIKDLILRKTFFWKIFPLEKWVIAPEWRGGSHRHHLNGWANNQQGHTTH